MGDSVSVPIDHFVWKQSLKEASSLDRLLFFDERGTLVERDIQTGTIEEVLKVFDGRVRAVRRSSGGMTEVEPCQVVLVTTEVPQQTKVRIRVRFKDIAFEERNGILVPRVFTHTKIVAAEEIREPFSFSYDDSQQFVLDMGHGIVPVYVFHYESDADGTSSAFFVDFSEVESALAAEPGATTLVQPYSVPRAVLRYASIRREREGKSDYETARDNLLRIKRDGGTTIAECLKSGEPIAITTGVGEPETRNNLQLALVKRRRELADPLESGFLTTISGHEELHQIVRAA